MAQQITQTSNADTNIGIPKKLTALDWFLENLSKTFHIGDLYDDDILGSIEKFHQLINEAKRLEKEQIVNSYLQKRRRGDIVHVLKTWDSAEKYYNETYNNHDNN